MEKICHRQASVNISVPKGRVLRVICPGREEYIYFFSDIVYNHQDMVILKSRPILANFVIVLNSLQTNGPLFSVPKVD